MKTWLQSEDLSVLTSQEHLVYSIASSIHKCPRAVEPVLVQIEQRSRRFSLVGYFEFKFM